jgi:hypothetical protein
MCRRWHLIPAIWGIFKPRLKILTVVEPTGAQAECSFSGNRPDDVERVIGSFDQEVLYLQRVRRSLQLGNR